MFAFVIAQAAGGPDINIVTLITQVGFSAVFLWQWLDATKERRAAQKALASLAERLLPVLAEATSTLEKVQASMANQLQKAERSGPSPDEMAATIRRLERVTSDLSDRFRGDGSGDLSRDDRRR